MSSYFVVANARYGHAISVLAGDRNLTNILAPATEALPSFRWTKELHEFKGNLLFADGHVEKHNNTSLAGNVGGALADSVVQLPRPAAQPGPPDYTLPQPLTPETPAQSQAGTPNIVTARSSGSRQNNRVFVPTPFGLLPMPTTALISANSAVKSNPPPATLAATRNTNIHNAEQEEPFPNRDLAGILELKKFIQGGYWLLLMLLLLLFAYAIWREWQKRKSSPPVRVKIYEDEPIEIKARIHAD
ncbi:MAG: hypothetical protein QM813_18445 [Verrucomicrobiota bacterium]